MCLAPFALHHYKKIQSNRTNLDLHSSQDFIGMGMEEFEKY